MMIRNFVKSLVLVTAFAGGVACGDLGAALDGAECFGPEDCGPLTCVAPNPDGLNLSGIGWCLDASSCVVGEQPYCPCGIDPASSEPLCAPSGLYGNMVSSISACWDGADMASCLCLPPNVTCKYAPP